MRSIPLRLSISALIAASLTGPAPAADIGGRSASIPGAPPNHPAPFHPRTITGRAAVVDGRTLWFPRLALSVRLADIDTCQLPQWSFDPRRYGASKILKPVPCGGLAKAWLKRAVGDAAVTCKLSLTDQVVAGRCRAKGRDLAKEILRVGLARMRGFAPPGYAAAQEFAKAARHGMWGTYVLDMDEWRARAVDQTLGRSPFADFNLLAERQSEISPPFQDFRQVPDRTDH